MGRKEYNSYVAVWPCGCALAVCSGRPDLVEPNDIAKWIRQGASIERWSAKRVRAEWPRRMPECVIHDLLYKDESN